MVAYTVCVAIPSHTQTAVCAAKLKNPPIFFATPAKDQTAKLSDHQYIHTCVCISSYSILCLSYICIYVPCLVTCGCSISCSDSHNHEVFVASAVWRCLLCWKSWLSTPKVRPGMLSGCRCLHSMAWLAYTYSRKRCAALNCCLFYPIVLCR